MAKVLFKQPVGGDGGEVSAGVESKNLFIKVSYPVEKIVQPIKEKFIDKLKTAIPGSWDDMLIDAAWASALREVQEEQLLIEG